MLANTLLLHLLHLPQPGFRVMLLHNLCCRLLTSLTPELADLHLSASAACGHFAGTSMPIFRLVFEGLQLLQHLLLAQIHWN